MGYIRHHAIVVTGWRSDEVEEAHGEAVELGCACSPVVASRTNGYVSFCVFPDGSKEGWDESEQGNDRRNGLILWMRERVDLDWVEVQYGDDERETKIVRHSDEDSR